VSRLPPKSVPLLVWVAFDVTGLLAIANPLFIFHFIFHLSCFPAHLVYIPSLFDVYLNCLLCMCTSDWFAPGYVNPYLFIVLSAVCLFGVIKGSPFATQFCSPAPDCPAASYAYLTERGTKSRFNFCLQL
jgi:hypothetical protein